MRLAVLLLGVLAIAPSIFAAPDRGDIVGQPETCSPGITETVDEIMARDRAAPGPGQADLEAPSPVLPEAIGTSFKALGLSESGFIPPDVAGDVGATQILVHVNGRIKVFAKTGAPGALNTTGVLFWTSVANGSAPISPQVRYDRLSGRWIVVAVNSTKPNNRVMIAVQTTPGTITGTSSFTFYQFDQGSGGGSGDTSNVCDSPRIGVDNNALYIGCNMLTTAGVFNRVTVYVVRKSSIIPAPGTLVVTAFRDISNGTTGPGPFAPVGVDDDEGQVSQGYFVGVDIASPTLLQVRKVDHPGRTPVLSGNLSLTVPATTIPISQPASGSAINLDAGDNRLVNASVHKNKLTGAVTLWTSHANEVNASCASVAGGGRNGARWYEIAGSAPTAIDPLAGSPTLVQSGTLCDSAASGPQGYIYPSIVETGQGYMAMGSTFASTSLFAGVAAAGRQRLDPLGSTQAATVAQSGLSSYTFVSGGKNRWGGCSFTDVDPNDDQTTWTFQEYADSTRDNWAVRVVQMRAPPPPSLTGLQAVVCTGFSSVPLTLTGTGNSPAVGSEFFDPGPDTGGPGFTNHLTASSTGGVLVNGTPSLVLPASPATQLALQVSLSIDTTAATAGLKNVTIRNPDGQAAVGVGVIRVDQPSTPAASNNGPVCVGGTLQLSVTTLTGASYAWTGPNGFTSSLQNPTLSNVTPAAAGNYTVAFSGVGCALPPASTLVQVLTENSACSDGSVCTTGDRCVAGNCTPTGSLVCNDNNLCTADTCAPATGCIFTDTTASCTDGNVCTTDSCNPGTGCVFTNNAAACSDGNACTTGDTCGGGSCRAGTAMNCNDGNACTADTCDPSTGCVHTDITPSCNDGSVCTVDTCDPATGCVHTDTTGTACNDSNACTADSCDPISGCVHTDITASCSDGNACTADSCNQDLGCVHADISATCDDGNPCTDDSCVPATGCAHDNNAAACTDGNACTIGDVCGGGTCRPGAANACDDANACTADSCNPASGCIHTDTSASCDDGNVCTTDSCNPGTGCFHANNTSACTDGNPCTANDTCGGGTCHTGTAVICNDNNACTSDTCNPASGCVFTDITASCDDQNLCTADVCDPATGCIHVNVAALCNDGNVCTIDFCSPALGCVHVPNTAPCNDGNICTGGDTCGAGVCHSGTGPGCDDQNDCTDDVCDFGAQTCSHTIHADGPCSDGNACTTGDTCNNGVCIPSGPVTCDDANPCTRDTCVSDIGCVFTDNNGNCDDANACTADLCDPVTGCYFPDNTAACNDHDVCTTDSCDPVAGCVYTNNVSPCDDGNACTAGETCSEDVCRPGTPIVCNDNNACTLDSCDPAVGCVFRDNTVACDDHNRCTTDSCNPSSGCDHTNNTVPCSDNNACTVGDACGGGQCQSGAPAVCNDGSVCTQDSCDPVLGCVFTNVTAVLCNDNNVCTDDACNPASGCFHTNNTASCDDGNVCTGGDICSGGVCGGTPGPPPEVQGVAAIGHTTTTLSWTDLGVSPKYDIASATLSNLRAVSWSGATCLVNDVTTTSFPDPRANPSVGDGYYYLVRVQLSCGTGTYGFDSSGAERVPVAACP